MCLTLQGFTLNVTEAHDIAYKAVYEHFALQKVHELTFILSLIEPGDKVLEIGCDAGGTTWALAECGVKHFGIDLPGEAYSSGLAFAAESVTTILWGDSHDSKIKLDMKELLDNQQVDVLIIDGDHTYAGVQQDFAMYSPLCKGMVIFHDICHHVQNDVQVERFYGNLKSAYTHIEFASPPYDWGGIGIIQMPKSHLLEQRLEQLTHANSQS